MKEIIERTAIEAKFKKDGLFFERNSITVFVAIHESNAFTAIFFIAINHSNTCKTRNFTERYISKDFFNFAEFTNWIRRQFDRANRM